MRDFLVSVPHTKGGTIVWTCVKEHVIDEKEYYKEIGLRRFGCKLFEKEEGGGEQEGLDGYPYLNHIIQLWPGDWVIHMEKIQRSGLYEESFYIEWG